MRIFKEYSHVNPSQFTSGARFWLLFCDRGRSERCGAVKETHAPGKAGAVRSQIVKTVRE